MRKQRNPINHDSNFLRNQIHTLAIFSQQSGWKERLKNLIEVNGKMMENCAISMENPNDMLKERIRGYDDDE